MPEDLDWPDPQELADIIEGYPPTGSKTPGDLYRIVAEEVHHAEWTARVLDRTNLPPPTERKLNLHLREVLREAAELLPDPPIGPID